MKVLLDTQVFIFAATEDFRKLPKRVRKLLADPATDRLLSSVTEAEVAIKTSLGKLNLSNDRFNMAVNDMKLAMLPFTRKHAARMFNLSLHHREPFDRMILATALAEDLPLVGGDGKFGAYRSEGLRLIWD